MTQPSVATLLREQILVILAPRIFELGIFGLLILLSSLAATLSISTGQFAVEFTRLMIVYPLLLVFAAFWAVSVWQREGPRWRQYHAAMPQTQATHDLIRTLAGWLLLLPFSVVFTVLAMLRSPAPEMNLVLPLLLKAILGVSTVYFLSSAAAITSRHPARWIAGIPLLLTLLALTLGRSGAQIPWRVFSWMLNGPVGVLTALGQRFFDLLRDQMGSQTSDSFWFPAAALWLAISILLLISLARRYRETG